MARVPLPLEARRRDPPATVRGAASAAARLADVVRRARPGRRTGLAAPLRRPPAAGESGGRVAARGESLPGGAAPVRPARVLPLPLQHAGRAGDRKSTRLNSSHLVISYAVFCLKKKNKIYQCAVPNTHE